MYRIINLLIIIIFWGCADSNKEVFYINDSFDIIYKNDTTLIFYSKRCINPSYIYDSNSMFYISSKAFNCYFFDSINYVTKFNKININLKKGKEDITIESSDSCFINYFGDFKSQFIRMRNNEFDFQWDSVEVIYFNDLEEIVKKESLQREKIDRIFYNKLWIISNPKFKIKPALSRLLLVKYKFYNNDTVVLEKDFSRLPCWYNYIK